MHSIVAGATGAAILIVAIAAARAIDQAREITWTTPQGTLTIRRNQELPYAIHG